MRTSLRVLAKRPLTAGLLAAGAVLTGATPAAAVGAGTTTAGLWSSPNPSCFGQLVTLTAAVGAPNPFPAEPTPTGKVAFSDGITSIGPVVLDANGHATLTTSTLAQGTHSLTISYFGDAWYSGSTSPAVVQTVLPPCRGNGARHVKFTATYPSGGATWTCSGTRLVNFALGTRDKETCLVSGNLAGYAVGTYVSDPSLGLLDCPPGDGIGAAGIMPPFGKTCWLSDYDGATATSWTNKVTDNRTVPDTLTVGITAFYNPCWRSREVHRPNHEECKAPEQDRDPNRE